MKKKTNTFPVAAFLGFALLLPLMKANACPPLPVLLYPVEEIYAQNGWEIPNLPDDAIAVIGEQYLSKADYKQWLYRKIGFDPSLKLSFLLNRKLENQMREAGMDLDAQLGLLLEHFFRFEIRGRLYQHSDEWHAESTRLAAIAEPEDFRANVLPRIRETYLEVLYLIENWDTLHAEVLAPFGVEANALYVPGNDPALQHIIKLLNAYYLSQRLATRLKPHITQAVLAGEDINLPSDTEEYIEWLYANHNTKFLVENYLGMVLSGMYSQANNLYISEQIAQDEFQTRLREYKEQVDSFNARMPESATPLAVSPVYTEFIMTEVRDDLFKSRAHRRAFPLTEIELVQRYYNKYGYQGEQNEVREIFKWIRRRRTPVDAAAYGRYVAAEEERIRADMLALRERILADGVESFPIHAISANRKRQLQQTAGRINMTELYGEPHTRWGGIREYTDLLESLPVNEISPVMKGPWNTIDMFWVTRINENERVYYMISEDLPPLGAFDHATLLQDQARAREDLDNLRKLVEQGASFDTLAQEHSDSAQRHGVDISRNVLELYGFNFARQISAIPEGGMGIIETADGLHLVQISSRTVTPLSEEIRASITKQYIEELAEQDDRYVITTRQLFNANPYFRTTD
jgi:hypothetical protein